MIETALERDGTWLRIALAAPPGNVLSLALVEQLRHVIAGARDRPTLKWLTIESAGKDFSFGASIPEHLPEHMPRVLPESHRLLKDLLAFPAATAALVKGRCLGGGFELALACDDIIATPDARFALPEIQLGAFPPAAAALLPPRVGASRATRAIVTGEVRLVEYWHGAGLVSMVAPQASLFSAAQDWFDRYLAPRSAVALSHAAQASRLTLRAQAEPALDAAEAQYLHQLLKTADAAEGIHAWIDKRPPQWKNR
jgi:cyclohexa-1,5-dienecarbonyl-CoA hydratase